MINLVGSIEYEKLFDHLPHMQTTRLTAENLELFGHIQLSINSFEVYTVESDWFKRKEFNWFLPQYYPVGKLNILWRCILNKY